MPAARTHYQILNVAPDAEPVVIEAAYRALMKKYHPDQAAASGPAGGPSAAEINRAFATLRDAERRAEYDRREWTRSQDIMMAPYRPPPAQRVSRVFGWGGWIVALVLGGVLALLASRANEAALARAEAARTEAGAEPDLRSQPTLVQEVDEGVSAELPPMVPAPAPAAAKAEAPRKAAARAKAQRPRQQPVRPRTAAEKDFLERQGYIY
ncbi:MAG TPA: J domain-containing protein [Allosphingosinicella sp.]|jgi:curved DNA-binding protein CbpA